MHWKGNVFDKIKIHSTSKYSVYEKQNLEIVVPV